uniref:Peroxisomal biogenesis factor 11 n=1 Tax=Parastrongyloides trichosuri TaxID=131310 RepID=A0A0N4ZZ91_PARTI
MENLTKTVRTLSTYAGRDKFIRSLYFSLILLADKVGDKEGQKIMILAKQLSAARMIYRQFNHFGMIKACIETWNLRNVAKDKIDFLLGASVTGIYTIYGVVEFLAWIGDAKIINIESNKYYKYCLYLWICALCAGIIRGVRQLIKKYNDRRDISEMREDIITTIGLSSDLIPAINSLPVQFLWSQSLPTKISGRLSLIASLIGLYKVF